MKSATIALLFCIFAGVILVRDTTVRSEPAREEDRELAGTNVSMQLNRSETSPDEPVRIQESVPSKTEGEIFSIMHDVVRIGRYDSLRQKLVKIDGRGMFTLLGRREPEHPFPGLHGVQVAPHGMIFNVTNPRQKGIEFEFTPKRLGIFLIYSRWSMMGKKDVRISSYPALLIVTPPIDKDGKPVIKKVWLGDDDE